MPQRAGRTVLVQIVVFVVILGALAIGALFWYQGQSFVTTDDAQVTAPLAPVGALAPGTLATWTVNVGDAVTAGQTLGTEVAAGAAASAAALPIQAPFAGTIVDSAAVAGQTVAPGVALAYVGDLNKAAITANIKETAIRNIAVGQKVDVTVDAFPGTTLNGTVSSIGLAVAGTFSLLPTQSAGGDFTKVTQRIPVVVTLQGAFDGLLPGENAAVRIHIR